MQAQSASQHVHKAQLLEPIEMPSGNVIPVFSRRPVVATDINPLLPQPPDNSDDTLCLSETHKMPDLSRHRAIVLDLAKQKIPMAPLEEESIECMASALYIAGIDSLETAYDFELDFIPPGPVFHSWYPLHNTTLFDGRNNPKGFNYVSTAIEEADFLATHNIPLLFIHSTEGLDDKQTCEMVALFSEQPNIVSLHIESDLKDKYLDVKLKQFGHERKIHKMDIILRYCPLLDAENVLSAARKKAISENKTRWVSRLDNLGYQSLTYLDFDNILFRPHLYQLAPPGFVRSATTLQFYSRFQDLETTARLPERLKYLGGLIDHYQENNQHQWLSRDQAKYTHDRLYEAILNDSVVRKCQAFKKIWGQRCWVSSGVGYMAYGKTVTQHMDLNFCKERVCLVSTNTDRKTKRTKEAIFNRSCTLDRLQGMQNLKIFHQGLDNSWGSWEK